MRTLSMRAAYWFAPSAPARACIGPSAYPATIAFGLIWSTA